MYHVCTDCKKKTTHRKPVPQYPNIIGNLYAYVFIFIYIVNIPLKVYFRI